MRKKKRMWEFRNFSRKEERENNCVGKYGVYVSLEKGDWTQIKFNDE